MGPSNVPRSPGDDKHDEKLAELRAIRRELKALRDLVEDFASVYLGAKFPFGQAADRFGRSRG